MAIPRSTMVMAALTCIPLVLAVRDYVKGGSKPSHDDIDVDADEIEQARGAQEEDMDLARERRAHERDEERKTQRAHAFDQLLGAAPATLGSAFRGLELGMSESMFDNHSDESTAVYLLARHNDLMLDLHASDGVLDAITIIPDYRGDTNAVCSELHEYLAEHWQTDTLATPLGDDFAWQSTGVRAELTFGNTCALSFRQIVPADAWIKKTGSPFPLWAIGQSSSNLMKSIEPRRADLSEAPTSISWTTVGVGDGIDAPQLVAYLRGNSKVVAVSATMRLHADTAEALAATLDNLLGERTESEDGALVWTKKPTARLEASDHNNYTLTAGTLPEE